MLNGEYAIFYAFEKKELFNRLTAHCNRNPLWKKQDKGLILRILIDENLQPGLGSFGQSQLASHWSTLMSITAG